MSAEVKDSKFRQVYDRVAWSAITLIAIYSATLLKDVSNSVNAMRTELAVMTNKLVVLDAKQKDFDVTLEKYSERIRTLELSSAYRRRTRSVTVYGE